MTDHPTPQPDPVVVLTDAERDALVEAFDHNQGTTEDWVITRKEWRQVHAAVERIVTARTAEARARLAPAEFRVKVACDGYASLTDADVPEDAFGGDEADAYKLGAHDAATAIRAALPAPRCGPA